METILCNTIREKISCKKIASIDRPLGRAINNNKQQQTITNNNNTSTAKRPSCDRCVGCRRFPVSVSSCQLLWCTHDHNVEGVRDSEGPHAVIVWFAATAPNLLVSRQFVGRAARVGGLLRFCCLLYTSPSPRDRG